MRTPIVTGSTANKTGDRAPGTDDVVMTWGIVAITFCLCCGLLVGALALPLQWLPGQLAVLVLPELDEAQDFLGLASFVDRGV